MAADPGPAGSVSRGCEAVERVGVAMIILPLEGPAPHFAVEANAPHFQASVRMCGHVTEILPTDALCSAFDII